MANMICAFIAIGLVIAAYLTADRSAPADVIAVWVVTPETSPSGKPIVAGWPFLVRYVVDNHDTCDQVIQQDLWQGTSRYAVEPPPPALAVAPGWQTTMYDAVAPEGIVPGPAYYAATIFWRNCWSRPSSWFWPISKDVTYGLPVNVLAPELSAQ